MHVSIFPSPFMFEAKTMTSFRRLTIFFVFALAVALTGCGSSTSVSFANPGGSFTNASLNGAYAFSVRGQNTLGFLAMAGSFHADGNGNLTLGVLDINSGGPGGILPNVPFTGTYTVRGDGQGTATLVTSFQNFTFDFVVISAQRALLIRFDGNATASGSIDLQSSAAFSNAALGGGFVFNLAGIDAGGNPFSTIGAVATDGAGNISSGVQDLNDNGTPTPNVSLTGSYSVPAGGNGRGTLILNSAIGTLNFVFYVVDGNRLKLVEIDGSPVFAGDAVRESATPSNASLSGPFAFTLGGFTSSGLPLAIGGALTADGAGNITSGFEDVNDGGTMTANNSPIAGTYSIAANGRGTATLNSGQNFAIYPTVNGVQIMGIDISELTFGSALAQQGTAFSNASVQGTYGMNLTGSTSVGEVDSNGQFTASGTGTLNGALDLNNSGAMTPALSLTGTYSVSANGRGMATLHSSFQTQNVIFYVVSSSRAVFIESDSNLVAVGDFEHQ
jgi:hypothetical protein